MIPITLSSFVILFITVSTISCKYQKYFTPITDIWTEQPWDDVPNQWGKKTLTICESHPHTAYLKLEDADGLFCHFFEDLVRSSFASHIVDFSQDNQLIDNTVDVETTSLSFPWKGFGLQAIIDTLDTLLEVYAPYEEGEELSVEDSPLRGKRVRQKHLRAIWKGKSVPWMLHVGRKSKPHMIPFPHNFVQKPNDEMPKLDEL